MSHYKQFLVVLLAAIQMHPAALATPSHPRLLLTDSRIAMAKRAASSCPMWHRIDSLILCGADEAVSLPPLQRKLTGKRLLDVSREALRRLIFLGYAYKTTGNQAYFNRALAELKNVATFSDWHPGHFLDVAEMTTAVAIGYDTFYDQMDDFTRKLLQKAIVEKGIKPSEDRRYNNWLKKTNNWNQVCNASMAYGALAVEDVCPQLADSIIRRSVASVKLAMASYNPDGAYPEGYSYWGYGTTYNVMLIDALELCRGTDYGLKNLPGFMKTPAYMLNMVGPDGLAFNFGDTSEKARINPAMFWFAAHGADFTSLYNDLKLLEKSSDQWIKKNRFIVMSLLWGNAQCPTSSNPPVQTMWVSSESKTPVALLRSSWADNAIYIGIKGGRGNSGHSHLDAGSFVMAANGRRWAMDFERQDYNSLESAGIDLWNMGQNSDRWKVFRYNNMAHNTLTFSGKYQNVDGFAPIIQWSCAPHFKYAIVDLSAVYKNQVAHAKRGVAIVDSTSVVVRDEIVGGVVHQIVRWNLLTSAHATIISAKKAVLEQNGEKLTMVIDSPKDAHFKLWTTKSCNSYDADNGRTTFIGFESGIKANQSVTLQVRLIPSEYTSKIKIPNLSRWGKL